MILEVAILNVKVEMSDDFERAFQQASSIIISMPGYISHDLQKCIEKKDRYLLLVYWENLEDHTVGFRQSVEYETWKKFSNKERISYAERINPSQIHLAYCIKQIPKRPKILNIL